MRGGGEPGEGSDVHLLTLMSEFISIQVVRKILTRLDELIF